MKTIAEYQADMNQADRVRRLVASNEYVTISNIIQRMKEIDIDRLLASENLEARHRINCFRDIMDEIQADIQRGEVAAEALKAGMVLDSPAEMPGQ